MLEKFIPAIVTRKSKETVLLLLSPPSERNKQRYGECTVCTITMLITNVEGRSFILLFVRHLSRIPEFVVVGGEDVNRKWLLLAIVKMGTALPIVLWYGMLCVSDSIHSSPYIQG